MKKILSITLLLSIIAIACSVSKQSEEAFINPGFESFNIPKEVVEIDAVQGGTISFKTGTKVKVPARAFVDANGKVITGKVSVEFREFHNAADIIVSGMPMAYDSAGKTNQFITAGMFEIEASFKNKKVSLAPNKTIQIDLATFNTDSETYNFYKLDTAQKNWTYISNIATPTVNKEYDSLQKSIGEEPIKPIVPEVQTANTRLLDIDLNYKHYPELQSFQELMWSYKDTSEVTYRANEWIKYEQWSNLKLERISKESAEFKMTLENRFKTFESTIIPVLNEKNYSSSLEQLSKSLEVYNNKSKKYRERQEIVENQSGFERSIEVNSLGIYNCDRIMQDEMAQLTASFTIDGKEIIEGQSKIYLICADDRSVIPYGFYNNITMNLPINQKKSLLVILPNNKIAKFSTQDFKKMQLDSNTKNASFNLTSATIIPSQVTDVKAIIAQL